MHDFYYVKYFLNAFTFFLWEAPVAENKKAPAKSEKTRGRILDAALRLFAEKGYQQTTMREIARESGASLGLAYRYFERKEDLVLAFYDQCAVQLEEEIGALPGGKLAD